MVKQVLLFIVIALFLHLNSALAVEVSFMDSLPKGTMGAWGGGSSFKFNYMAKEATLSLKEPSAYSGGYIVLSKPADLLGSCGSVALQIKGGIGGETLFCLLEDAQNYQTKIDLNHYVNITSEWQRVYLPLRDFPVIGENWESGKLKTAEFDWGKVKAIIFQIKGKEEDVYLKGVSIVDGVGVDFVKGGEVVISPLFNAPVDWRLKIVGADSGVSYGFSETGTQVEQAWDSQKTNFQNEDAQITNSIRIDQLGYHTEARKAAFIVNLALSKVSQNYYIKEARTGKTMFKGVIAPTERTDDDSQDKILPIDFSLFKIPGRYYFEIPKIGRSYDFEISSGIYDSLLPKTLKAFYFQRCGEPLKRPFSGKWSHAACHLQDAYLNKGVNSGNQSESTFIQSVGGWHDAGDYGKKVVPGALSAGILLRLYEMFPDKLSRVMLDIPESGNGTPDFLNEVKYELQWLLTMQRGDGGVYHLIATERFPPLGTMPPDDGADRYLVNVSSTATANFAASLAIAARVFKKIDPQFATKALASAEKAWVFLEQNPNIVPPGGYKDPPNFMGTGKYEDSNDRDERFWAATELFRTTGELKYGQYILGVAKSWTPSVNYPLSWGDVHNLGMFTYAFTQNDLINNELQNKIKGDIVKYADKIVEQINTSGYKVALRKNDYHWGSNSVALNYAMILIEANEISPSSKYMEGILDQLHYVLGRNPLNLSYVTGVGTKSPQNICHNPSVGDGLPQPVPGFLVGGPDTWGDDPIIANAILKYKLPPAKAYVDDKYSYSANEVTVYWNASLAFVVGYLDAKLSKWGGEK